MALRGRGAISARRAQGVGAGGDVRTPAPVTNFACAADFGGGGHGQTAKIKRLRRNSAKMIAAVSESSNIMRTSAACAPRSR